MDRKPNQTSIIMQNGITIQEVVIGDHLAAISELMQGLQASEISLFEKSAPWEEIAKNYLVHMMEMQEENEGTCLVAYAGTRAIGFVFGYLEEQDNSRIELDTGPELYVSDGYVHPSYRKQGIYKELNRRLEEKYAAIGVKRMMRFTLMNNEPMKRFLESAGYRPTRILYEKWL